MAKATKKTTKKASVKPSEEKAEVKLVRKIPKKRESWTQEKVEVMCKAIAEGKSYKEAYTKARVAKTAFYAHLGSDGNFKDCVKKAEQAYQDWYDSQLVVECKRSLIELIRGFEYDEVTTETGTDMRGKPVERKKVVRKKYAPNPTAIIFALCNRDPEHWQNRVNNELSGKITTEAKSSVSLASVPDDLLGQVIDAITNGK